MTFKVDWCSHEAAKYAVETWHYSKRMPSGTLIKLGVWEDDKFVGAVIFSHGANQSIGKPFGLTQFDVCELTRIAMTKHKVPVTQVMKIAIKMLKKKSPNLQLIVSYSDFSTQKHIGAVYQAGNWVYVGHASFIPGCYYESHGKLIHGRSARAKYGTEKNMPKSYKRVEHLTKFKYLYPLTVEMREKIEKLRKPYPKKHEKTSALVDHTVRSAVVQTEEGGSIPTSTHPEQTEHFSEGSL